MRFFAVTACLLAFSLSAIADLSWEYVDQRSQQTEELLEQRPAIEAIAARERAKQQTKEPSPEEKQAYEELGQALANHPEMAQVNQAEHSATEVYQQAVNGGNTVEISLALQTLAEAKTARYHKAASIPELKLAIDKWQQAANAIDQSDADSPGVKSGLDAIQAKLKALGEAMGR
jgi:hypothetical protein